MTKNYLSIVVKIFSITALCCMVNIINPFIVNARQNSQITNNEATGYQYKLHMARGSLSFSEGYFDTAIKSFKKAIDLNPQSPEARSKYTQAILYRKLGIIMEATESG